MTKKSFSKKIAAVVVCLLVLSTAFSASSEPVTIEYNISASVDTEQLGSKYTKGISALADILDSFTVSGVYSENSGSFDVGIDINSYDKHEKLAEFRLYGDESHIMVTSPLTGEKTVLLNMDQWLEFALKMYFHMGLPMQRVALASSKYVTERVWSQIIDEFVQTIGNVKKETKEGKWRVSHKDALELAQLLSTHMMYDGAFDIWVKSTAIETGYDEYIMSILGSLPDWFEDFSGGKDIIIEETPSGEKWTCNDQVLFVSENNVWSVSLPKFTDGSSFVASGEKTENNGKNSYTIIMRLTNPENADVLNVHVREKDVPEKFSDNMKFAVLYSFSGAMVPQNMTMYADVRVDDSQLTVNVSEKPEMKPWLVISGKMKEIPTDIIPEYTVQNLGIENALNIFSLNDAMLEEIIGDFSPDTFVQLMPFLAKLPGSAYQGVINFLDESGVMENLTQGGFAGDFE